MISISLAMLFIYVTPLSHRCVTATNEMEALNLKRSRGVCWEGKQNQTQVSTH